MPVDRLKKEAEYRRKVQAQRSKIKAGIRREKRLKRQREEKKGTSLPIATLKDRDRREIKARVRSLRVVRVERNRELAEQLLAEQHAAAAEREQQLAAARELARIEAQREEIRRQAGVLVTSVLKLKPGLEVKGINFDGVDATIVVVDPSFAKKTKAFTSLQERVTAITDQFCANHPDVSVTVVLKVGG